MSGTPGKLSILRQIDRDTVPVMGRLWDSNAVTRNLFTTDLGVGTALGESTLKEGLLLYGSDDGLVQVSEDGGKSWRKIESFPGVPDMTMVSDLRASRHDVNTIYAAFNNYQRGDFKPFVLKSADLGRTWTSIAGDLPARHFVWSVLEDSVNPDLLFAGTEFGLFVTLDGGRHWNPLRAGVPTIAFRRLEEQEAMTDLVCATFGRGIFILDDYTPLRQLASAALTPAGDLLPMRNEYEYDEVGYMAAAPGNHVFPNPAFGAELTYYLRDDLSKDSPRLTLTVADADGKEVRRLEGPASPGLHRVNWDLRLPAPAGARGGRGGPPDNDDIEEASSKEEQMEAAAEKAEAAAEAAMATGQQSDSAQELQQANPGGERGGERAGEAAAQRGSDQTGQRGSRRGGGGRGGFGRQAGPLVKSGNFTVTLNKTADGKLTPIGQPRTFAVMLLSAPTAAQEKPKDPQAGYDPRSAPGEGQKLLEKLVGDWDVEEIFHPRTGDPVITKGECRQTMINDGRFLKSEFVFHDGATNATGLGLVGFEADSGLFTSVWADSRSTKMSIRQSKDRFDGHEIIMSSFPMAGGVREARPSRNRTRLVDDGRKIIHQQFAINPDDTERLMMELILTKKSQ